ncbi:MAG: DUF362 domain-containing protein [Clostridiales bacterium]|nr:DUF362 domain-containing protein [Candidatus Crickella merdequi]
MKAGIDALGGIKSIIGTEEKVLVKPNFLSAAEADKAITTHPAVIEGMFRILNEEGFADVAYGDSPGHGSCEGAAKKLDLQPIADKYGVARADMETSILTEYPEGQTAKSFHYCKGIVEADAIINLCKMKTHALERITGAVKNVYGYICGAHKAAGHVKYPNPAIFARMLADIHNSTDTRVHIMDGIIAMEGNGPSGGDPIEMGVMLFSKDPVALDTAFCHIVYLNPEIVPTNAQGEAMGIGTYDDSLIEYILVDGGISEEITVEQLQKLFGKRDFKVDRKGGSKSLMGRLSAVSMFFAKKPVIKKKDCIKCGICVDHCPVPGKAVDFRNGDRTQPPVYDYKKCIRCYCCQEMCPQKAITVRGRG